ncbi:MAG: PIN domain-containing protein [Treponema sp.]|jgi:predicted nucleic acid-binding protein|nr:PIN domain-containing protein [Treponema sp.]
MTENRFVLDTNAVIFLTTRGNIIPASIEDKLNKADVFISVITEIELLSKAALPPNEEENLRAFFSDRISIIDITDSIKRETITLRRSVKLKLPDCIVAATAIVLDSVLLTADKELLSLDWHGFRAIGLNE